MTAAARSIAVAPLLLALAGCGEDPGTTQAPPTTTTAAAPPTVGAAPIPPTTAPGTLDGPLEAIAAMIVRGEFDAANQAAEDYLADHPQDGRAVFLVGLAAHKQRFYERARPSFERALELSPEFFTIHHFFGYCLYNLGDLPGAAEQFRAHLEHVPKEADSHFGLGLVELEQGNLDEAQRQFLRAIELTNELRLTDPQRFRIRRTDLAKSHARLGDVLLAREDYAASRDRLIKAIEIDPDQPVPYYTLHLVYRRMGNDELAEEALRRHALAKERTRLKRPTAP